MVNTKALVRTIIFELLRLKWKKVEIKVLLGCGETYRRS